MTFPATFKEFAEQYKIVDKEEVYTNGIELIPIFRVEQWLDNANIAILQAEIERLQKYNTDVAFKHYNDGKKDAAREIFEEIEREIELALECNYKVKRDAQGDNEGLVPYVEGKIDCLRGLADFIAKIKKKYEILNSWEELTHTCQVEIPHSIESIVDIAFQESENRQ